jgi:hypothetical protein
MVNLSTIVFNFMIFGVQTAKKLCQEDLCSMQPTITCSVNSSQTACLACCSRPSSDAAATKHGVIGEPSAAPLGSAGGSCLRTSNLGGMQLNTCGTSIPVELKGVTFMKETFLQQWQWFFTRWLIASGEMARATSTYILAGLGVCSVRPVRSHSQQYAADRVMT